jgi:hypothetical protein
VREIIFVDENIGSKSLIPLLEQKGLPVQKAHLGDADVEFVGRGIKGEPVRIGIELKRLSELTGDYERFAGEQVPKLQHYDHKWLVFEGEWQQNKKGLLFKRTGRASFKPYHGDAMASRLRKKLLTLEMCAGLHVQHIHAHGREGSWSVETVRFLVDLYTWWADDDLDAHKSHIVNYQPIGLIPMNDFEHAFAAWPGLSSKRAKPVAKIFRNSIRLACSATVEDWAEITVLGDDKKPRRLGKALAARLVRFVNGEK